MTAAPTKRDAGTKLLEHAPYRAPDDPLDRVLAYVAFRKRLVRGDLPEFTCLAGTLAQETFAIFPAIAAAAGDSICGHAATLEADIEAAMQARGIRAD